MNGSDRWVSLASELSPSKPETLVVNLYGGPGTGKSTTAAHVFYLLKNNGYNAELVTEFAKDLVWEERHTTLNDQVYVLGKQSHRISRLFGKVDIIVTDSPLLMTHVYASKLPSFSRQALCGLASAIHEESRHLDIYIKRDDKAHPYNPKGRYQDLAGAQGLDREILKLLEYQCPDHLLFEMSEVTGNEIYLAILDRLDRAWPGHVEGD